MRILSLKPGHDGSMAHVEDGELVSSLEAEKDSFPRFQSLTPKVLLDVFEMITDLPDVVCESGWIKGWESRAPASAAGYYGVADGSVQRRAARMFGRPVERFSSTHERSHIFCSFGLSPFEQGQPCYVLVQEGALGRFYRIDECLRIEPLGEPLWEPGSKYSFSYHVADAREAPPLSGDWPGKVMALAAYGARRAPDADERAYLEFLFERFEWSRVWRDAFAWSPFYRVGIESQAHKDLARQVTDAIFERFHDFAVRNLRDRLPLVIGGGCGLNCEWNSRWRESGLFDAVFVPPCTNDTGSAIGTAIDAQHHLTGNAKLRWDVYRGAPLRFDDPSGLGFSDLPLDLGSVARWLAAGEVVAWVQGRCEIGPRALGHRSLLASPRTASSRDRLNRIKGREAYRPVAPVCLEQDARRHFSGSGPSPHMLFFSEVIDDRLPAVTHVDGSARVQTVRDDSEPRLAELLQRFRVLTGVGVLCNTSLNQPGKGFINGVRDLLTFCADRGIDHAVAEGRMFVHERAARGVRR